MRSAHLTIRGGLVGGVALLAGCFGSPDAGPVKDAETIARERARAAVRDPLETRSKETQLAVACRLYRSSRQGWPADRYDLEEFLRVLARSGLLGEAADVDWSQYDDIQFRELDAGDLELRISYAGEEPDAPAVLRLSADRADGADGGAGPVLEDGGGRRVGGDF